jgi:citronellol/citronellal dehydrogenase
LWPRTIIATAALGAVNLSTMAARAPEIVADAAYEILRSRSRTTSGNFFIDEDVLAAAGCADFSSYAMSPDVEPRVDLFVNNY